VTFYHNVVNTAFIATSVNAWIAFYLLRCKVVEYDLSHLGLKKIWTLLPILGIT